MKKAKKLFSLILAVAMCLSFSVTAFAAETDQAVLEKHVVTLSVKPGDDAGIMPAMWDQNTYTVGVGITTYTPQFIIPDRYFAYEMSATGVSGAPVSVPYSVALMYDVTGLVASQNGIANGVSTKYDWIDLGFTGGSYLFRIINGGSEAINVTLTYYSWK